MSDMEPTPARKIGPVSSDRTMNAVHQTGIQSIPIDPPLHLHKGEAVLFDPDTRNPRFGVYDEHGERRAIYEVSADGTSYNST